MPYAISQVVFFLVTYVLPMLGLSVAYCHLGSALWRDQEPQQSMGNRRKVNDKRKLAKMFIVILIVFGVCWLPYHSYFIYTYHNTVSYHVIIDHRDDIIHLIHLVAVGDGLQVHAARLPGLLLAGDGKLRLQSPDIFQHECKVSLMFSDERLVS